MSEPIITGIDWNKEKQTHTICVVWPVPVSRITVSIAFNPTPPNEHTTAPGDADDPV